MIFRLACFWIVVASSAMGQTATDAPIAELRWLDRMTGQQGDVSLPIGVEAYLGDITLRVDGCRYPARAINDDAFALVSVRDAEKSWFNGWMVASSPALNALEHPRYDVWILRCKTS